MNAKEILTKEQAEQQMEIYREVFTVVRILNAMDLRLYKLIGLEIEALMKEHDQTMKNIARYSEILNNYDEMQKVIISDLERYKKSYGEERKTDIINAQAAVFVEKKIEEMPVVFLMDRFGYCRTVDTATYERNKEAADSESRYVLTCRNTDRLCLFTDTGKMYTAKVQELPYGKFRDKAFPIDNYSNFDSAQERIVCVSSMEDLILGTMLFVTKYGMTKTVSGYEYDVRTRTSMATKLNEGDEVLYAGLVGDHTQLVLQSAEGGFLRFPIEEIPEKKKAAIGVRAMKLSAKDHLEEVYALADGEERTIIYKEKEVALQKLKNGSRDQKGTKIRV